jgi:transcription antitermination protein NusB
MSHPTGETARWDERHRAREAALRALYQQEIGGVEAAEALALVEQADDEALALDAGTRAFAARLAVGTWADKAALDGVIEPHCTNWRIERLAVLDRLVMRLAVREWLAEPGTPPRVVLSEALELARAYSGEQAVGFVNGVLDAVYHQLKSEGRIIDEPVP